MFFSSVHVSVYLQLTGVLLEKCDAVNDEKRMDKVIDLLKDLITEPSLSRSK